MNVCNKKCKKKVIEKNMEIEDEKGLINIEKGKMKKVK